MARRLTIVRCIYFCIAALCFGTDTFAENAKPTTTKSDSTKSNTTGLDEFLQGLQSLQADFRQVLRDGQGRLVEESKGVLAIHRPNRFRWDYKTPHEQVIVADGERLWLYDVDLEQVTVRPMEQSLAGTPAILLSGSDDLRTSFKVERTESKGNVTVVTLAPKRADTDFKRVRIKFSGKQLDSMELSDKLSQSTTLEFSNVQRNATLDDARFVFTPPAGVDVIGADSGGKQDAAKPSASK
jgi:outer membrane lipoprotein carrier protein